MKKILTLVLCLSMVLTLVAVFASCGKADYKLGMGVVVSMDSSKTGNAQVDATVAAVVTDADGKIVACRIDVAQNKMNVANGAVEANKTFKTKMELGNDYGMAPAKIDNDGNGVTKEWFEQAKAFEAYVVGKTVAEVEAIQTQEKGGHKIAVDQVLLDAGCSMQITDFIAAVAKACKDDQAASFSAKKDSFTLGVAAKTAVDSATKAATATDKGVAAMYTDFAAAVVVDGKIVAALNDAIQPKISFNAAGEIADTDKSYKDTKRALKGDYGMAPAKIDNDGNGVTKEWFEQSKAFSEYVVGKTATEVAAMQTQEKGGHMISVDQALLDAGCSIQIPAICAVVAQAATNAR